MCLHPTQSPTCPVTGAAQQPQRRRAVQNFTLNNSCFERDALGILERVSIHEKTCRDKLTETCRPPLAKHLCREMIIGGHLESEIVG